MLRVEQITDTGKLLAIIVRGGASRQLPTNTTFVTSPQAQQQVGYIVYPKGGEIAPHVHLPIRRELHGTGEVLIVLRGSCLLRLYGDNRERVQEHQLVEGDVLMLYDCGHGFVMLEDTVFFEVKQGPYLGLDEKERFTE